MSKSPQNRDDSGPRDEDRLAAIDERQQRLMAELDRLNDRVEEALLAFGGGRSKSAG